MKMFQKLEAKLQEEFKNTAAGPAAPAVDAAINNDEEVQSLELFHENLQHNLHQFRQVCNSTVHLYNMIGSELAAIDTFRESEFEFRFSVKSLS